MLPQHFDAFSDRPYYEVVSSGRRFNPIADRYIVREILSTENLGGVFMSGGIC